MLKIYSFIVMLLVTIPVFSYGMDNPAISSRSFQVSQSTSSLIDWNKIKNWFRPVSRSPVKPEPTDDTETARMPAGHWLMVTPYSECRDDGVCPPDNDANNDEGQK